MKSKTYVRSKKCSRYLRVYCTLSLHHVIEYNPKSSELSVQYQTHIRKQQKKRRMLECRRQDTKEAMISIDNMYGLIKLINLYQINHYCVTGIILNLGAVLVPKLHTLTQDAVSSFYVRIWNKLVSMFV